MDVLIRDYNEAEDYSDFLSLIKKEGEEWKEYLDIRYSKILNQSISYVAYVKGELCGYVRSLKDGDMFIWVIDLLVDQQFRGHSIGKQLLEKIRMEYPDSQIFIMSDVDEYYEKLGFHKEGSIYRM